ncbi:aldo/keto reductase [Streptomyces sp. KL116D]|uniref:aldo/keto reductase n=1 Tax=Streptomyces sp. KL116D TaxID=3045152 RepID=UPI00355922E4
MALGRYRKNATEGPASAARPQARFDMSTPANQRKLEAVEQLAVVAEKAGHTLIELAVAFVINHPGVTSAIIGPRTMDQLEAFLPAADITLSPTCSTPSTTSSPPASPSTRSTTATATSELRADQRRR